MRENSTNELVNNFIQQVIHVIRKHRWYQLYARVVTLGRGYDMMLCSHIFDRLPELPVLATWLVFVCPPCQLIKYYRRTCPTGLIKSSKRYQMSRYFCVSDNCKQMYAVTRMWKTRNEVSLLLRNNCLATKMNIKENEYQPPAITIDKIGFVKRVLSVYGYSLKWISQAYLARKVAEEL